MAITTHKLFHRAATMVLGKCARSRSGSNASPQKRQARDSVESDDSALHNASTSSLGGISATLSAMSLASHTSLELFRCSSTDSVCNILATTDAQQHMRFKSKNGTAHYEGDCGRRSQFSGIGVLVAGDFAYAGEWKDSKPHGYGVYVCASTSSKYEGHFQDGAAHGHGRLVHYDEHASTTDNSVYAYGTFTQGAYEHRRSRCSETRAQSVKAMSQARKVAAIALAAASANLQRKYTSMARAVSSVSSATTNNNANQTCSMNALTSVSSASKVQRLSASSLSAAVKGSNLAMAAALPKVAPGAVTSLIQCMH